MNYFLRLAFPVAVTLLLNAARAQTPDVPTRAVQPVLPTQSVSEDPDDPAIWVNRRDPAQSLVIGTNKIDAGKGGALYVFGLDGRTRQIVKNLDRPNNVDVEYGLKLGGRRYDIAVCTERLKHRLRVFAISRRGRLSDLAPEGLPVFKGETGDRSEPMGIALYKRPTDGEIFAMVGRKSGPAKGYLHVYHLHGNGNGLLKADFVKSFGAYSGKKEIESVCVDDALGYVYYSDEQVCVRKYPANPDSPYFGQELGTFGRENRVGDHEGIAIYTRPNGTGYIISTDQIPAADGGTLYYVYKREGEPGDRHNHTRPLLILSGGADETDGIEIISTPLGKRFPNGLLATMNSGPKNFLLFDAKKAVP
ncbi:MAG: phytase [Akkermansiaceae bacterium]|nr:phytase [Armatimonadota bacterium]